MTEAAGTSHRYTAVAIALHWVIALLILSLIPGGWFMGDLPNEHPLKESLYQLHKSVGITILILTLARIAWRVMNPPPEDAAGLKGWEAAASHAAHIGFYALMLAMPLTGWLYVSTAYAFDVPTVLYGMISWPDLPFMGALSNPTGHGAIQFVHSKLAWVMLGLVALHIAGALKHELGPEDGVLKRMIPGLFGRTEGPRAPARGAVYAFGGAIGIFAAIAALPVLAQGAGADLSGPAALEANWSVDETAERKIAFSGTHEGDTYSGTFERWTAAIAFEPDNLPDSRVDVTVDLASAIANKKLYTDSLKAAEWLDSGRQPTATVTINGFAVSDHPVDWGTPFTASAALTLKDITTTVPMTLQIEIDGQQARMAGTAAFSRSALNVGMASDPGADWVGDQIAIDVALAAQRTIN